MHPDVILVQPDGAFIKIEQVRSLIGEIAFQPFEARYRFVIFDGADQMRAETANSLLKTLEEPPSRTVMILVTTLPYLLLETIRSRSQMLQFGPIPQELIAQHLIGTHGWGSEDAHLAAMSCEGSLGAALSFDIEHFREVRKQALRFVSLLLKKGDFAEVSPLAANLAKKKDAFVAWIDAVALLLQDIYYAQVNPSRVGQSELIDILSDLSQVASKEAVISSINAIKNLRNVLRFNVNRQIALESLFLEVGKR
jgi:DNA polymerase-3 subunit delta'